MPLQVWQHKLGLTSTTQNEICGVAQLRSSGQDHWLMAHTKRVHDTRISGAKACGVQHLGPSLTHEWHTAGRPWVRTVC